MFEIGQKLLCIDDRPKFYSGLTGLAAGSIYTVTDIFNLPDASGSYGVALLEARSRHSFGFRSDRFRSLDDPSIELFQQMARNCDVPVRALEGP